MTSTGMAAPNAPRIDCSPNLLLAQFDEPQRTLSHAIVRGGFQSAQRVAWVQVRNHELPQEVEPVQLLAERLRQRGVEDAVGLLTSREVAAYEVCQAEAQGQQAVAVATVGLSNALRAGDPPVSAAVGTINILAWTSAALTDGALVEALALVSEAKALAVREAEVPSRVSGQPASGTGTDCLVVACPQRGTRAPYAGKHTTVGHLVGLCAFEAVQAGVKAWKRQRLEAGLSLG